MFRSFEINIEDNKTNPQINHRKYYFPFCFIIVAIKVLITNTKLWGIIGDVYVLLINKLLKVVQNLCMHMDQTY